MITVRSLAYQILLQLDRTPSHSDRILRATFVRHAALTGQDRALLTQLVYGVLRWQKRLDWHIDQLSSVPHGKITPEVRILLRLGLYQILFLNRIPHHAAVNETIKIAKHAQRPHVIRFINGILRSAIRCHPHWNWPSIETDPAEHLAVTTSHPTWFTRRLINKFGYEKSQQLCEANNRIAPLTLRANTSRTNPDLLMQSLRESGLKPYPSPYLATAVRLQSPRRDITEHPAYQQGWIQIQDEASQLVVHLLAPESGERVLDLCSGFGGKSTHCGHLMENQGEIVAVDHSTWKLAELEENAARQGITIIRPLAENILKLSVDELGTFDRVLVDAPCTGFGVLRRNPDIKWRRNLKDPHRFSRTQKAFLQHATGFVRRGGILVYATCTLFTEENEGVAEWFEQNFGWNQETAGRYLPEPCRTMTAGPYFRSCPHRHDVDGFFAARWRRLD